MVTLFWNVGRQDLRSFIAALVNDNDADLLVLAENLVPVGALLESLNEVEVRWQFAPSAGIGSHTQIFVRGAGDFVEPLYDLPRMSIRRVAFPAAAPFILAAVHLRSPMWRNEDDQASSAREFVQALATIEEQEGHSRCVVIGDLNMDPYSKGLTFADSWNAVRTYDIARSLGRVIDDKPYSYFYNPMWRLFHDGTTGPPGTFFHQPSGYASIHWHILDQVLLRPAMLNHFEPEGVSILDQSSQGSLANPSGRPHVSDHFPVLLGLNL